MKIRNRVFKLDKNTFHVLPYTQEKVPYDVRKLNKRDRDLYLVKEIISFFKNPFSRNQTIIIANKDYWHSQQEGLIEEMYSVSKPIKQSLSEAMKAIVMDEEDYYRFIKKENRKKEKELKKATKALKSKKIEKEILPPRLRNRENQVKVKVNFSKSY